MRAFRFVAFLFVFVGAAIPRLIELGRSLWAAEAWVANSFLADSLGQIFYYDSWLQTTPPLFLLLARGTVEVVGISNVSLRLLPFAFGMAAVVLTAALAVRLFTFPFAILAATLVALAPTAVRYSLELKQYTADLAASAAILLALWSYTERRRRACLGVVALFSLGLFLSHTTVMFAPLAACVLLFAQPERPLRARIVRAGGFLLLVAALSGLLYFVFTRPNLAPNLDAYWKAGFLQGFQPKDAAVFYTKYLAGASIYFFLPDQSKDLLKSLLDSTPDILRIVLLLGVLGAIAGFVVAIRRDARRLRILSFCLAPPVALIALNMMRLYPVNSRRLMLFLLPCVSLGIVLVLDTLWNRYAGRLRAPGREAFSVSVGVICVVLALVIGTRPVVWHVWETEDVEGAVRYLKSAAKQGDAVFVHASAAESVKLYARLLDWRDPPIVYGTTGWPCCIRDQQMQSGNKDDAAIARDVERARAGPIPGSLWMVYGHLAGRERGIQLDYLQANGCSGQQQGTFTRFTLYKLSCSPP